MRKETDKITTNQNISKTYPKPKPAPQGAKFQRLNTNDYRLKFTRRLCGGTINMQNKPNLLIHSSTHLPINQNIQNKPNSTNAAYKLKGPPKVAQLNNQLSIINYQWKGEPNLKPNSHMHKKTINNPRPKAESTNNQLSIIDNQWKAPPMNRKTKVAIASLSFL